MRVTLKGAGITKMESVFREMIRRPAWEQLMAEIRRDSQAHDFSSLEASRPENRELNRYRDVYPYDHSRVTIRELSATDYINASLVKAARANRSYILCQGPLPGTVGHFWLTIWQQNSQAVLMLNRVMEKGQVKCHQYWPLNPGEDVTYEDVRLKVENLDSIPGDHYTVRTFRLTNLATDESREIKHFHYTTWPDFGVPKCPDTFLEFLGAVRDSGVLSDEVGPAVIHCSAGIGRSGTFVLVDTCLVLIAKEGFDNVNIKEVLLDLRSYRMGLIQTSDQLKFSYLAIAEGARQEGLVSNSILEDLPSQHVAASSSDSEGDDCGPPPLPPPRTESLAAQSNNQISSHNGLKSEDPLGNDNSSSFLPDRLTANGNGVDHSSSSSSSSNETSPEANGCLSSGSLASNAADLTKTDSSPSRCILNSHKMEERKKDLELRRRRKEATSDKVSEVKRKMKEAETREEKKRYFWEKVAPFCVGLAILSAGVYGLSYYSN